jgi:IclR helix-turn-helix domain
MTDDNAGQGARSERESETAIVEIELTQAQIDRVIRDATGAGKVPILLSGLTAIQERLAREPDLFDDPRISASLMRGLLVFAALPSDGRSMRGLDLSRLLGIGPSTIHRYLATLVVLGLVEQDPSSRSYRLAKRL